MDTHIETERKFLIVKPTIDILRKSKKIVDITQTYLQSDAHTTERVRLSKCNNITKYIYCKKVRISDISNYETEKLLSEVEYNELLKNILVGSKTIHKTRYVIEDNNLDYEIDIYDFSLNVAIMEVEIADEKTFIPSLDGIFIIKEVSGDHRFSNKSISKNIPNELLE